MRVKYYRSEFIDHKGEHVNMVCEFNEIQAASVGAILEPDGISIEAATSLVWRWNEQRRVDKSFGKYSIVIVKEEEE